VPAREFSFKAYPDITSQPGTRIQTRRSPQPGSTYRDATNSATEAGSIARQKCHKEMANNKIVLVRCNFVVFLKAKVSKIVDVIGL